MAMFDRIVWCEFRCSCRCGGYGYSRVGARPRIPVRGRSSHQRPVGGLWSSFATAVLQWANGPGGEDEEAW